MIRTITITLLVTTLAQAQEPSPSPSPSVSQEEIEKALQSDIAAQKKAQGAAPAPASPSAAPGSPVEPAATHPTSALGRFFQSLNPDLSAIIDFAGGWYANDSGSVKNGDDPGHTGFNVQEVEVALQAVVDPYFRADIFLTIPNLGGLEVEEAFLTTTHLPWNFQLKAGIFRAQIGRQNTQHLHLQDFTRRPASNALFLGQDGLRSPGIEINWLVPRIPFYLLLTVEVLSLEPADHDLPLATFGGGERWDFAYVANARAFWDLTEATSLYLGLSYAHGKTSQTATAITQVGAVTVAGQPAFTAYDNFYSNLYVADLYLKWKPPNQVKSYASVAWQSEFFLRHLPDFELDGVARPQVEGGLYSQLAVQALRRWYFGVRGEITGLPSGDNVKREYAASASITWGLSEFARARIYGEVRVPTATGLHTYGAAFLQLEAAIGAHGAHPF